MNDAMRSVFRVCEIHNSLIKLTLNDFKNISFDFLHDEFASKTFYVTKSAIEKYKKVTHRRSLKKTIATNFLSKLKKIKFM